MNLFVYQISYLEAANARHPNPFRLLLFSLMILFWSCGFSSPFDLHAFPWWITAGSCLLPYRSRSGGKTYVLKQKFFLFFLSFFQYIQNLTQWLASHAINYSRHRKENSITRSCSHRERKKNPLRSPSLCFKRKGDFFFLSISFVLNNSDIRLITHQ
jgi:hypothetical protein